MTEFLELVKGAPNFNAMERDELVMYAYAMFAAGAKVDFENAKLRKLCGELLRMAEANDPDFLHWPEMHDELRKLGVEVDG